jgi:drug/metabolite transporter (DMT)-like permease
MNRTAETRGLLLGGLGMLSFSVTLPLTRLVVAELDPVFAGLGRALVAAALAVATLAWRRDPFPARRHLPGLAIVALGVVVGFPLFLSLAMRSAPASHGAVVVGLIPLSTALFAVLRTHERPSRGFWMATFAGSAAVVGFALAEGGGRFQAADGLLLLAVIFCGLGYAEGGRLARELGGWRVISWALVLAAPFIVAPVVMAGTTHGLHASVRAWAAFGYTGAISMFLGFWAWYYGLAHGGVARVSQVQLLQPFFTITWAAVLLGEHITLFTVVTAVFVAAIVAVGRRTAILRPAV